MARTNSVLKSLLTEAAISIHLLFVYLLLCGVALAGERSEPWMDQDGPVSVTYGDVFQGGELKIEPYDLTSLPSLPAGYAAPNNKAYRITTTAVVAGPHTIRFVVSSVTEEDAFKKLHIFHVDTDPYDPDGLVWADVAVLNSTTVSSSFSSKTIYGSCENLGVHVIAKQTQAATLSRAIVDLAFGFSKHTYPALTEPFKTKLGDLAPTTAQ